MFLLQFFKALYQKALNDLLLRSFPTYNDYKMVRLELKSNYLCSRPFEIVCEESQIDILNSKVDKNNETNPNWGLLPTQQCNLI